MPKVDTIQIARKIKQATSAKHTEIVSVINLTIRDSWSGGKLGSTAHPFFTGRMRASWMLNVSIPKGRFFASPTPDDIDKGSTPLSYIGFRYSSNSFNEHIYISNAMPYAPLIVSRNSLFT